MNIYVLFVNGVAPYYVRASYSFDAIAWLERKFGVHVSAWDIATSLPQAANVFTA